MVIKKELADKIAKAPNTPGVYIFKDQVGEVLYVGKAINLRKRLLYYTKDREDLYEKTVKFLEQTAKVNWIEVVSELEAILLEMNLIRTLKPKYNILNKDDKRPLFVQITNDTVPLVKTARIETAGSGDYIGPFPSSQKLRMIMTRLRRIFPYFTKRPQNKYDQMYIDLGLSPSLEAVSTREGVTAYKRQITRLKLFLRGKIKKVVTVLEKEMNEYAKNMEYEKAQLVKNQLAAIETLLTAEHTISEYLKDDILIEKLRQSQVKELELFLGLPLITRIEGYDVANTLGTHPTASMVVFEHGLPNTAQYRKFSIRGITGPNDPLMMYQTLKRRLNHAEWEMPDLILVDGGKTQVASAVKAITEKGLVIPVVGLAKRFEQLVIPQGNSYRIVTPPLDSPYLTLLRSVRDEAHRFTTNYHKQLRQRAMIERKP